MTEYWGLNCAIRTQILVLPCLRVISRPKILRGDGMRTLFFSHLLTQIYLNYGMDSIFLFGDFNARVEKVNDYNCEFDEIRRRKVIDEVCNKHGQSFIDFLNDSKFCVLNGRFGEQSTQLLGGKRLWTMSESHIMS